MIQGSVLNVMDFGASNDGTNAAATTAAIQAALDAAGDVWFPPGIYAISTSLNLSTSKRIIGGGTSVAYGVADEIIRTQVRLEMQGNFPCFKNKTGTTGRQYNIEGFNIFWENVTPLVAESATKGNRYGFYFVADGVANYTAPYSTFTDIEVNGAWQVYYDDTDNYLNKFKSVLGRFCRFGFYKRLGTLMHFEECGNSIGAQGFHFNNTISPILVNCAADELTPDATTPGVAANYFADCKSVSILGWDAEAAVINGNDYSYMNLTRTYGTITGFTGLNNSLNCGSGEFVSWFLISDESNITISGFNRKFNSSTSYTFAGASGGTCATVRSIVNARCTVLNSDVRAPSGGTPDFRYSVFSTGGYSTLIDSVWDNLQTITTRIIDGTIIANDILALSTFNIGAVQTVSTAIAAPVSGDYVKNTILFNQNPSAGGFIGWVCTVSGNPGTWKTFGAITP